jgi:hypothetical protein
MCRHVHFLACKRSRQHVKRGRRPLRASDKGAHLVIDGAVGDHVVATVAVHKRHDADAPSLRIVENQALLVAGMKLRHDRPDIAGASDRQSLAIAMAYGIAVEKKRVADKPFNDSALDLLATGNCYRHLGLVAFSARLPVNVGMSSNT